MTTPFLKLFFLVTAFSVLSSCASLREVVDPKTKIDPAHTYSAEGFEFRFAMSGDWFVAESQPGYFSAGQKPLEDGSTAVAAVRYGPMGTPGGKPMTSKELLDVFKLKVEAEANGGRLNNVETRFTDKKIKNAACLLFYQKATDNTAEGAKFLSNEGLICIHPTRSYKFIWMAVSERLPIENKKSKLVDSKPLFESLNFN